MSLKHELASWHKTEHESEMKRIATARHFSKLIKRLIPLQEKAAVSFGWLQWSNALHLSICESVGSMIEVLPKLELLDSLGAEITSYDSDNGNRQFSCDISEDGFRLMISFTVTPDNDLQPVDGRKCRKVVIGQNTRTVTTPKYAIVCD